jgi:hypothetical protein
MLYFYIDLDEFILPSPPRNMPQQARFCSYNLTLDEQRERLRAVATPIATSVPGNNAVLNAYSLYQGVNMNQPPATASRMSPPPNPMHENTANPPLVVQPQARRRGRADNSEEDFTGRPAQRCGHRYVPTSR